MRFQSVLMVGITSLVAAACGPEVVDRAEVRTGPFISEIEIAQGGIYDPDIVKIQCNELADALMDLASPEQEITAGAWSRIDKIYHTQGKKQIRIVPIYIERELAKRPKHDAKWLGQQGRLMKAAAMLEVGDKRSWESAVAEMLQYGEDGQRFLVAQMVRRLDARNPSVADMAQVTLMDVASDEAIDSLIAAMYVETHDGVGVFPRRVAETLAGIGVTAVPQMLATFSPGGTYAAPTGKSWKLRKFLVKALGDIGDMRAVPIFVKDLEQCSKLDDDSRFLYEQYLLTALGRLYDIARRRIDQSESNEVLDPALMKTAVDATLKVWKRCPDHAKQARGALFSMTKEVYDTPDKPFSKESSGK